MQKIYLDTTISIIFNDKIKNSRQKDMAPYTSAILYTYLRHYTICFKLYLFMNLSVYRNEPVSFPFTIFPYPLRYVNPYIGISYIIPNHSASLFPVVINVSLQTCNVFISTGFIMIWIW